MTNAPPDAANSANTQNGNTGNTNSDASEQAATNGADTSAALPEAKAPEKYQARVSLKFEAIGENGNAGLPELAAAVARDGADKRMEFNLPNGQKIVYLELGPKKLVILPDRKQYAELSPAAVGFEVRSLMTPEQIVQRAKSIRGLEKTGEEKYNGRDAVKYKYSAVTKTNTKAGDIDTESFVYVDKETGLPLKTEVVSKAKDSSLKGFQGLKMVTEISDIKTEVSADLFKEPEGYEKIEEEQIRDQINLVFKTVTAFLSQMIQTAGTN